MKRIHSRPALAVAAMGLALLLLAACDELPKGTNGSPTTKVLPQVKISLQEMSPITPCSATLRYVFEGDEIDPGMPRSVKHWSFDYPNVSSTAFPQDAGGVTWHCVYSSLLNQVDVPEEWEGNLRYDVLQLVTAGLDPWDPSFLVLHTGRCYLNPIGWPSDYGYIESLRTTYVNFATSETNCVRSTDPLAGFPDE